MKTLILTLQVEIDIDEFEDEDFMEYDNQLLLEDFFGDRLVGFESTEILTKEVRNEML